ncbi:UNVERIFIED_CONTAM: hypothetical protein Cloal_4257 [Acetivibrio alkalicellulosi]
MIELNDEVFGKMQYDSSWVRKEKYTILGKELDIRIVAKAYEGQGILDIQRKAFIEFKENFDQFEEDIPAKLLKYYLENYENISEMCNIPEKIDKDHITQDLIVKLVKVKTIYFGRKGEYGYLCDCIWEQEHGIAIILSSGITIDEQDTLI